MRLVSVRFLASACLALGLIATGAAGAAQPVERVVQVENGVRLHVLDANAEATKTALVLLPGWLTTVDIWGDQIARLSSDRRVIAVDPRSQGKSTKTAEAVTPEQRARDLHTLLQKLKVNRYVLLGWSQGAQDVAAFVEQFGTGSMDGAVIVDATISGGFAAAATAPEDLARQLRFLEIYQRAPSDFADGFIGAIVHRQLPAEQRKRLVDGALQTPRAVGVAMLINDLYGRDRTPSLAKFDRPTLVLAAASSPELEAQKRMAAAMPNAKLHIIDDSAHAVFVDQPEQFSRELRAFIESIDRG